ncbi:peptidoglycan-binding domain-containing protein [Pseudogemmobacter sonorensis]|uniref:peptidoglycan-binding domain-containing protein n=1 Tax=Pseudogemmobacter sonorensis TaxID=2989681 RepID=UPI0036C83522
MLPMLKNTSIAALAAVTMATAAASPALAWGKKEQGFVAGVAAAIIIDEIIESKRHRKATPPAPVYVAPRPPVHVAPSRPVHTTSIHATPAAQAFKSYSVAERRAIQRRLKAHGYYRGGVDGVFGQGTYNAITAYARDTGHGSSLRTTGGAFAVYDGLLF